MPRTFQQLRKPVGAEAAFWPMFFLCFGTLLLGGLFGFLLAANPNILSHPTKHFQDGQNEDVYVRGSRWGIYYGEKIDVAEDAKGLNGETDCKQKAIFVRSGLPDAARRETIMHELFHAGACKSNGSLDNFYWNSKTMEKHEGIHRLGEYLSDLLRENPDLTRYFAGDK